MIHSNEPISPFCLPVNMDKQRFYIKGFYKCERRALQMYEEYKELELANGQKLTKVFVLLTEYVLQCV